MKEKTWLNVRSSGSSPAALGTKVSNNQLILGSQSYLGKNEYPIICLDDDSGSGESGAFDRLWSQ